MCVRRNERPSSTCDMSVQGIGAVLISLVALLPGCGSSPESSPTTPSTSSFTLRGTVRDDSNAALAGVAVRIIDGPNANGATSTDGNGAYTLGGLSQAGFSVR